MSTAPQTFGALLRRYRVASGLTQEALAEQAGLSTRGLSDLERGARRLPYRHTVRQLGLALGLTRDECATLLAASRRVGVSPAAAHREAMPSPPLALTTFVGRDREVAEVTRLLGATRLLTLTGAGGIGKNSPGTRSRPGVGPGLPRWGGPGRARGPRGRPPCAAGGCVGAGDSRAVGTTAAPDSRLRTPLATAAARARTGARPGLPPDAPRAPGGRRPGLDGAPPPVPTHTPDLRPRPPGGRRAAVRGRGHSRCTGPRRGAAGDGPGVPAARARPRGLRAGGSSSPGPGGGPLPTRLGADRRGGERGA